MSAPRTDVPPERMPSPMSKPKRISYGVLLLMILLAGWLHMATPLLVALFSYFALSKLHFLKTSGKWVAVVLFLLLVSGVSVGLGYFVNETVETLPRVVEKAIPSMIDWAKEYGMESDISDYEDLKKAAVGAIREQLGNLKGVANIARNTTRQLLFVIVGCVVAISIFLNARFELDREKHRVSNNLYSLCGDEIGQRFAAFFRSFSMVMGAQMIISGINTVLTATFVLAVGMPHPVVIIGVTFLCGLLPVIGNLISNTIIVAIGFTIDPKTAILALVFLVLIHKLEYFLNSKIIGERIRNPIWLTLLGLILGEKLMGLPGMILAPVVLHYIKMEAAQISVPDQPTQAPEAR
jgi:predicted PurR-regulated permease PerM